MGVRGRGAMTLEERAKVKPRRYKWQQKKLSRLEKVIAFCESLPCTSGIRAGKKFRLDDWQKEWLAGVYAEDAKGRRPCRNALLSIARKNGKTALISMLCLAHMLGPESEERGQCISAANDRNQAALIFAEMVAILQKMPDLLARVNIRSFQKEITVLTGPGEGTIYRAISADAKRHLGLSPSFAVCDELGSAIHSDLYSALETAMGARAEPLLVAISTQAPSDHHFFSEIVDRALRVQSGEEPKDESFHGAVYAAHDDDDPFAETTWRKANPASFRSFEDIARQAADAQKMPSREAAFRNLILNLRTSAETRFVNKLEWLACGAEPRELAGRICYAGLDLSWSRDLSALVLVFPDADTFDVKCHFWLPGDGLAAKARADRVPWTVWRDDGYLTTCPGKVIRAEDIAYQVKEAARLYDLRALSYDRWGGALFKRELEKVGCDVPLLEHGQGYRSMNPACDRLERAVAQGRLRHGNNPILTMCASNACVTLDPAGNKKLSKDRSDGKIDGLVALAMGLTAAADHTPAKMPACLAALV